MPPVRDPREIPLTVVKPELKLLYAKIGSRERLEEILQDFYARMGRDVLIGFFFDGKDVAAIARRQMDFLLKAMGASESYSGLAPAQAHDKLAPILSGHFDRRLQLLEQTLKDHGLEQAEIETWLRFENAFRGGIVRPEGPLK
jgi:truncated hemoglobin YjbI